MAENAPRRPILIGTYLEVEGCLGEALVGLLRGDQWTLNCGWFCDGCGGGGGGGGAGALREPMDSNRSFPVMSTLRIDFAAIENFCYMLDFKSSMSCLGSG